MQYLLVDLDGGGELDNADVAVDGERAVVGVDDQGGDAEELLGAIISVVVQVVLTSNNGEVARALAVTAVSSGDHVVLGEEVHFIVFLHVF